MRLLVLLLALGAVAALAYVALAPTPGPGAVEEGRGREASRPRRPSTSSRPSTPERAPVAEEELPEVGVRPVLVLSEGGMPDVEGAPAEPDTLVRVAAEDEGRVTGADVVFAVSRVVPLRFHVREDLERLRRLDPPRGLGAGDSLPLVEILEHWREQGFENHAAGAALLLVPVPRED